MELISREEAVKVINEIRNRYMIMLGNYGFEIRLSDKALSKMRKDAYEDIDKMMEQISTIESRQKASWSITINQDYRCSNCELITSSYKANFCPHCGSEMINSASKEKKNEQSDKSG